MKTTVRAFGNTLAKLSWKCTPRRPCQERLHLNFSWVHDVVQLFSRSSYFERRKWQRKYCLQETRQGSSACVVTSRCHTPRHIYHLNLLKLMRLWRVLGTFAESSWPFNSGLVSFKLKALLKDLMWSLYLGF